MEIFEKPEGGIYAPPPSRNRVKEHIKCSKTLIIDKIKKNKRFSFAKLPSSTTDSGSLITQKTLQMENKAMVLIVNLAQEAKINFEYLMNYRLTDLPLALFNVNGSMRKVVKSKLIEYFCLQEVPTNLVSGSRVIVDMGYIWRLGTPTKEDRQKPDRTSYKWGDYATKLLQMIISRHPHAAEFYLVNDRYDIEESIKDSEHIRRAGSISFSKNVFPKRNVPFPPVNQVEFFANPSNKIRLQKYLKEEFTEKFEKEGSTMFYNIGSECIKTFLY